jgi:hypothetical protein
MYWFNPGRIVKNRIKEKLDPITKKLKPILDKLPF